nr:hypothetical protein BaRGS_002977 [Batillaria attramentaria]
MFSRRLFSQRLRFLGPALSIFIRNKLFTRNLRKVFDLHDAAPTFILDELRQILQDADSNSHLTDKYYAMKAFHHVKHCLLKKSMNEFLDQPQERQALEEGAMLVSQWFQPLLKVTYQDVDRQLNGIADKVRKELRNTTGNHPACDKDYRTDGIAENLWSPEQCHQVLDAVNTVLFQQLGFSPNEAQYYTPDNSYIDKVLEQRTGIPITLCIVYSAVARRLGVVCEPVNFPAHFLLRWKEHPMATPANQFTFVDAYNRGRMMSQKNCHRMLNIPEDVGLDPNIFEATTPAKVFERMARNMVRIARQLNPSLDGLQTLRSAIDLYLTVNPNDSEMRLLQVRIFLHLNINLKEAIDSLQQVAAMDMTRIEMVGYLTKEVYTLMSENEAKKQKGSAAKPPKRRKDNDEVEFSVGMVMKHKRYHYTCVIYGWDKECRASEEWITQMGVQSLPGKQFQPFYNVLVEDGSNRYAAQENLLYTKEVRVITHPEVGRYFDSFTGRWYIPNKQKEQEYPDDIEVTRCLVDKFFSESEQQE